MKKKTKKKMTGWARTTKKTPLALEIHYNEVAAEQIKEQEKLLKRNEKRWKFTENSIYKREEQLGRIIELLEKINEKG